MTVSDGLNYKVKGPRHTTGNMDSNIKPLIYKSKLIFIGLDPVVKLKNTHTNEAHSTVLSI